MFLEGVGGKGLWRRLGERETAGFSPRSEWKDRKAKAEAKASAKAKAKAKASAKANTRARGWGLSLFGDPVAPGFRFGEGLDALEALAGEAGDVGGEEEGGGQASEGAEGEGETDLVVEGSRGEGGDGLWSGDGLPESGWRLAEEVVVLKEGEAAFGLGILKPGYGLEFVFGVQLGEVCGVGSGEAGDEGVVVGGEAELPTVPVDSAVGDDMAGGDVVRRGVRDEVHAKGFFDELDAGGESEAAGDGGVNGDGLADGVRLGHSVYRMTCR